MCKLRMFVVTLIKVHVLKLCSNAFALLGAKLPLTSARSKHSTIASSIALSKVGVLATAAQRDVRRELTAHGSFCVDAVLLSDLTML
ncbi:hypothetical protein DYB32_002455 [Aphanomyces invadans]|uniref:Uncharacterized protein n=1 Tax=Aphanomyces invadans TaxID=157072 RepID=A0A3R6YCW7_9STRA|nr:hypothetical protein DYB32_002455 [Aphanomyces invadans]